MTSLLRKSFLSESYDDNARRVISTPDLFSGFKRGKLSDLSSWSLIRHHFEQMMGPICDLSFIDKRLINPRTRDLIITSELDYILITDKICNKIKGLRSDFTLSYHEYKDEPPNKVFEHWLRNDKPSFSTGILHHPSSIEISLNPNDDLIDKGLSYIIIHKK